MHWSSELLLLCGCVVAGSLFFRRRRRAYIVGGDWTPSWRAIWTSYGYQWTEDPDSALLWAGSEGNPQAYRYLRFPCPNALRPAGEAGTELWIWERTPFGTWVWYRPARIPLPPWASSRRVELEAMGEHLPVRTCGCVHVNADGIWDASTGPLRAEEKYAFLRLLRWIPPASEPVGSQWELVPLHT